MPSDVLDSVRKSYTPLVLEHEIYCLSFLPIFTVFLIAHNFVSLCPPLHFISGSYNVWTSS